MSNATALAYKYGIEIIRSIELKKIYYRPDGNKLLLPINVNQEDLDKVVSLIIDDIEEEALANKYGIKIHRLFEISHISYDFDSKKLTIPKNMKHEAIEMILQGLINEQENKETTEPEEPDKPKSHLRLVI